MKGKIHKDYGNVHIKSVNGKFWSSLLSYGMSLFCAFIFSSALLFNIFLFVPVFPGQQRPTHNLPRYLSGHEVAALGVQAGSLVPTASSYKVTGRWIKTYYYPSYAKLHYRGNTGGWVPSSSRVGEYLQVFRDRMVPVGVRYSCGRENPGKSDLNSSD